VLDDLLVVMPFGELGYKIYQMEMQANPDYGYLIMQGRIKSQGGPYAHANADALLRDALKRDDWKRLLVMEHDHIFPANVFRVHAKALQPIYAAAYVLRDVDEPLPVWFMWDKKRINALRQDMETLHQMIDVAPGVYPVDCVPMGCTSIDRKVLETWPADQPFFSSYTNPRGATISHDIFFCRVAQDNGWQAYIDTRLRIEHLVLTRINLTYFVHWYNVVGHLKAEAIAKENIEAMERDGIGVLSRPGGEQVADSKFKLVTS
jgi:hypothetical protein